MKPVRETQIGSGGLRAESQDWLAPHDDTCAAALATAEKYVLSCKTRELIALGMCMVLGRDAYLIWRIEQAVKNGACEPEILEVARLAIEMAGDNALESTQCALDTSKDIFRRLSGADRKQPPLRSQTEINP